MDWFLVDKDFRHERVKYQKIQFHTSEIQPLVVWLQTKTQIDPWQVLIWKI